MRISTGQYTSLCDKTFGRKTHLSKVAHQIKHEQDNEHETEPASASGMAAIGIATAAKKKNKNNDKEY
jgi:hypothetical protein